MRAIAPLLTGFIALAAVSTYGSPELTTRTGVHSARRYPSASETKRAARDGTRPSGATGEATDGGVLAFHGLSVLAMYAALEHGPVAVVSPIVAGYPLVTLLLSRAFLKQEQVGLQMIGGVTSAVCGVVLLLVT